MGLDRNATSASKTLIKDQKDTLLWSLKDASERLWEAYRLHCMNFNLTPDEVRLNKMVQSARKRS